MINSPSLHHTGIPEIRMSWLLWGRHWRFRKVDQRGVCYQVWQSELNPSDLNGGKRELTPPWCVFASLSPLQKSNFKTQARHWQLDLLESGHCQRGLSRWDVLKMRIPGAEKGLSLEECSVNRSNSGHSEITVESGRSVAVNIIMGHLM